VFCNEDEAKCFAEVNKIEYTNFMDIAVAISKWKKVNTKRPRVAIITQGKDPIVVAENKEGEYLKRMEYIIPKISHD
jgi:adenosine kinase